MADQPGPADSSPPQLGSRRQVQTLLLMAATAAGIYLCLQMILPFLSPLAWALALAVLFAPLQRLLEKRLGNSSAAALVSVLLIALIVVIPLVLVVEQLAIQTSSAVELIAARIESGSWRRDLQAYPGLLALAGQVDQQFDLPGTLKALSATLGSTAAVLLRGSLWQLLGAALAFYLLFFLLRDRYAARQALRALSPLSGAEMNKLFGRIADTVHATLYGTLVMSALQGTLGGLMFWWLGLPEPLLWGLVMAVLAIVPVLGTSVVWGPASLYLLLAGHWVQALILFGWGMLVVGMIDNLLRPVMVGARLRLHTVPAFLSVLGGLMLFGSAGLILGPVTLTVTDELLELWRERGEAESNEAELAATESR